MSLPRELELDLEGGIATLTLARETKANALSLSLWQQLGQTVRELDDSVRCVLLQARGPQFSSGIDLADFATLLQSRTNCPAARREQLLTLISALQKDVSALAERPCPTIAAVQGACIGGGLAFVSSCDLRYCTTDAWFQIREVDLGLVADVGTLQRLLRIVPAPRLREWAFTGRRIDASEALESGLVNRVFDDLDELRSGCALMAREIVAKSPRVLRGLKTTLAYAENHDLQDSLQQVALWNAAFLESDDLRIALQAVLEGKTAKFND